MKKTLAIMMVLVLAVGAVFATSSALPRDLIFTVGGQKPTERVRVGYTLDTDVSSKLNAFGTGLWLVDSNWVDGSASLPSNLETISLDAAGTDEGGAYLYKNSAASLWVLVRNAAGELQISSTPLANEAGDKLDFSLTLVDTMGMGTPAVVVKETGIAPTKVFEVTAAKYTELISNVIGLQFQAKSTEMIIEGDTYTGTLTATWVGM